MKMIPDRISPAVQSNAEKKVFEKLQAWKGKDSADCICLHSLGVATHLYGKRYCEIDFLIVGPFGLLGIEVKGGAISYSKANGGKWSFTNRYGQRTEKSEGPGSQVRNTMFSLEQLLRNAGFSMRDVLTGWAVILPDMSSFNPGTELEPDCLMLKPAFHIGAITEFLDNAIACHRDKLSRRQPPVSPKKLSPDEVEEIVNICRPDIDPVRPLSEIYVENEEVRFNLTEDQYRVLDGLQESERILIKGVAGSGKTLLAIEKARRLQEEGGKKILFLCYNKLLWGYLKRQIKEAGLQHTIDMMTINQYMHSIAEKTGTADCGDSDKDFYARLPAMFAEAVETPDGLKQYDALIMDEAQDYMANEIMMPLGSVLRGGWAEGCWVAFMDDRQLMYASKFDNACLAALSQYATPYYLTENLRNSKKICRWVNREFNLNLRAHKMLPEGEKLHHRDCSSDADLKEKLRSDVLQREEAGASFKDMTLLYGSENDLLTARSALETTGIELVPLTEKNVNNRPNGRKLAVRAIDGYKGLDSPVVFLVGRKKTEGIETSRGYVGFTRARDALFVYDVTTEE